MTFKQLLSLLILSDDNALQTKMSCQTMFVRIKDSVGSPLLQGEQPGLNREFEEQLPVDMRQEKTRFWGMWVVLTLKQK